MTSNNPAVGVSDLLPQVEITATSIPYLLARTARADMRTYRRSPAGASVGGPVFVVGSPRSGTTFLGAALSAVGGVSYHFEPIANKAALPYIHLGLWSDARSRRFTMGVHHLLMSIHADWGRTMIDKQPSAVFILGQLGEWYPMARFIVLARDGRDVVASWAERPWLQAAGSEQRFEPGGYEYGPNPHFWVEPDRVAEFRATTTEHRCAWGWRRHNEAWLEALKSMPEDRVVEIRYEAMVTKPIETGNRIADFLRLGEPSSDTLRQSLRGANERSVGRWRDSPVASDEAAQHEMGAMLERLGYS